MKYYYVLRTYKHNDKEQLWKVMTRRIKSRDEAEFEKYWHEKINGKAHHEFFIVSKEEVE